MGCCCKPDDADEEEVRVGTEEDELEEVLVPGVELFRLPPPCPCGCKNSVLISGFFSSAVSLRSSQMSSLLLRFSLSSLSSFKS